MEAVEDVKFFLTIEKQLQRYTDEKNPESTDRHRTLWHSWNQNKRWIRQLLELTLPSFPTFSRHDVSHSQSVLHNIESILGEQRISKLSATDCFVLLHTAYLHDIGMCITFDERAQIVKDHDFD